MQIHRSDNPRAPFLSIVACQHGDEPFGLEIIRALEPRLDALPGLQLIVANEEALALSQRGIDGDLNRSFPGDVAGHHEQRLACQLLELVKRSTYVLDIHTSVSRCGRLLPILTALNERTRTLVNLLDAPRILLVEQSLAARSLIDRVAGGLSLEFEKSLADETSVQLIVKLVEDLYAGKQKPPREREVYIVTDVLPTDLPELATAQDFDFLETNQYYPVLINRHATMGNQGLMATHNVSMTI